MIVFYTKGVGLIKKNSILNFFKEDNDLEILEKKIRQIKQSEKKKISKTDNYIIVIVDNEINDITHLENYTNGVNNHILSNNESIIIDNELLENKTVIICNYGDVIKINDRYTYIRHEEIYVSKNLEEINTFKKSKILGVKKLSQGEQDALIWLDKKEVDETILSLCYFLYPALRKHDSLKKLSLASPKDHKSIMKMIDFFQNSPKSFEHFEDMKELTDWKNVVENWEILQEEAIRKNYQKIQKMLANNKG